MYRPPSIELMQHCARTQLQLDFGGNRVLPSQCYSAYLQIAGAIKTMRFKASFALALNRSFLLPSSRLGTPLQAKLLLCERNHLFIALGGPSRSLGKFTFPSRSLGTRERRDALRFPALRSDRLKVVNAGNFRHIHTAISISRTSSPLTESATAARYSWTASWILCKASSSVSPWDQHPGKPGQETL